MQPTIVRFNYGKSEQFSSAADRNTLARNELCEHGQYARPATAQTGQPSKLAHLSST